jgi:hypothetical protein
MMNQGHRPTFDDGRRVCLRSTSSTLTGTCTTGGCASLDARFRPIHRFDRVEALQAQLEQDRVAAVAALAQAPGVQDHNRV